MIRAGDTLANEITGETIHFLETAEDTNGAYTLIEVTLQPGGGVPMAHVHPYQSETFEVVEGELSMKAGRERVLAQPGDVVSVAPGERHRFWNASSEVVRFRCTVAPALQFERFIETMFALAADGRLGRRGMPSPLRLAPIALAHFDDVRAAVLPGWLQKAGLAPGAGIARLFGYAATYERIPETEALVPATA